MVDAQKRIALEIEQCLADGCALDKRMAFSLGDGIGTFLGSVVYTRSLSEGNILAGVKFADVSRKDSLLLNRFLDSHLTQKA